MGAFPLASIAPCQAFVKWFVANLLDQYGCPEVRLLLCWSTAWFLVAKLKRIRLKRCGGKDIWSSGGDDTLTVTELAKPSKTRWRIVISCDRLGTERLCLRWLAFAKWVCEHLEAWRGKGRKDRLGWLVKEHSGLNTD